MPSAANEVRFFRGWRCYRGSPCPGRARPASHHRRTPDVAATSKQSDPTRRSIRRRSATATRQIRDHALLACEEVRTLQRKRQKFASTSVPARWQCLSLAQLRRKPPSSGLQSYWQNRPDVPFRVPSQKSKVMYEEAIFACCERHQISTAVNGK